MNARITITARVCVRTGFIRDVLSPSSSIESGISSKGILVGKSVGGGVEDNRGVWIVLEVRAHSVKLNADVNTGSL
jgi:hypothetical protein